MTCFVPSLNWGQGGSTSFTRQHQPLPAWSSMCATTIAVTAQRPMTATRMTSPAHHDQRSFRLDGLTTHLELSSERCLQGNLYCVSVSNDQELNMLAEIWIKLWDCEKASVGAAISSWSKWLELHAAFVSCSTDRRGKWFKWTYCTTVAICSGAPFVCY